MCKQRRKEDYHNSLRREAKAKKVSGIAGWVRRKKRRTGEKRRAQRDTKDTIAHAAATMHAHGHAHSRHVSKARTWIFIWTIAGKNRGDKLACANRALVLLRRSALSLTSARRNKLTRTEQTRRSSGLTSRRSRVTRILPGFSSDFNQEHFCF